VGGGGRFILLFSILSAKGYFCTSFFFASITTKGKAIRKEIWKNKIIIIGSGDADGPPVNLDNYH